VKPLCAKEFRRKNGLEVNTNLIFADTTINSVGIATTIADYTLHVNGGIGATDLYVSGVATASAYAYHLTPLPDRAMIYR